MDKRTALLAMAKVTHCWHKFTASDPYFGIGDDFEQHHEPERCCQCGRLSYTSVVQGPQTHGPFSPHMDVQVRLSWRDHSDLPPCVGKRAS